MFDELLTAVKAQEFENVQKNIFTCDINQLDSEEKTPLYWAVFHQNLAITELLLKHGATTKLFAKNNDSNDVAVISLLDDPSLEISNEIRTLLMEREKQLSIKTLRKLEAQVTALQRSLIQEQHFSHKTNTVVQSLVTGYSAAISGGCFYYGFYKAGTFFTALTTLMGAIDYKAYQSYKSQPHRFNCYRENLLDLVEELKMLAVESTLEDLEKKLKEPNEFLTLTDLFEGLKTTISSVRSALETESNAEKIIHISNKFAAFSLFKIKPLPISISTPRPTTSQEENNALLLNEFHMV